MDLTFSQADIDFQMEVRRWIEDNYPQKMRDRKKRSPGGSLRKEDHVYWQQALHTKGWSAPGWPVNTVVRVSRLRNDTSLILRWRAPERLISFHLV